MKKVFLFIFSVIFYTIRFIYASVWFLGEIEVEDVEKKKKVYCFSIVYGWVYVEVV